MIRYSFIAVALASLIAAPVQAGESHNSEIGFSAHLVKSQLSAGRVGIEIFADPRVDVASLVAGLDLSKPASAQSISDRVNEKRALLYPDEEIILSVTPPRNSRAAAAAQEKAGLVKALYWWNNTNCSTCYWFAQYTSTVATLFIDDVQYGAYKISDKVGTGNWILRYTTGTGGASTRYTVGPKVNRGFRGDANGVSSKADIVIYFFN